MAKGLVERIGIEGSLITHQANNSEMKKETDIPDHKVGIKLVMDALLSPDYGALTDLDEIVAVGHRVVHGGEKFTGSVLVDAEVMETLHDCCDLAPLHNPANITGIKACQSLLPNVPQIAVFDTAFHQTMPEKAYIYGVPYKYYEQYDVRRYGFHGTSHQYVSLRAAKLLGRPLKETKVVTCHLGNGCSISAVNGGISVDTSLGFGTISGVIMGTRPGDVDPAVIPFLMEQEDISPAEMRNILYKQSGLHGISGVSADVRDVEEAAEAGNKRARLALDMLCYHTRKYIGAYATAMGGLDAIVFTAGIGENSATVRSQVCQGLEFLGAKMDPKKNAIRGKEADVSTDDATVRILVIPTNEELMIAQDTATIVGKKTD